MAAVYNNDITQLLSEVTWISLWKLPRKIEALTTRVAKPTF